MSPGAMSTCRLLAVTHRQDQVEPQRLPARCYSVARYIGPLYCFAGPTACPQSMHREGLGAEAPTKGFRNTDPASGSAIISLRLHLPHESNGERNDPPARSRTETSDKGRDTGQSCPFGVGLSPVFWVGRVGGGKGSYGPCADEQKRFALAIARAGN